MILKKSVKGFSLIELMVCVCIISTLSAISMPYMRAYLYKAKIKRTILDIRTIEKDLCAYNIHYNTYPATLIAVGRHTLKDPWGTPYQYTPFAEGKGAKGKGGIAGQASHRCNYR